MCPEFLACSKWSKTQRWSGTEGVVPTCREVLRLLSPVVCPQGQDSPLPVVPSVLYEWGPSVVRVTPLLHLCPPALVATPSSASQRASRTPLFSSLVLAPISVS